MVRVLVHVANPATRDNVPATIAMESSAVAAALEPIREAFAMRRRTVKPRNA
jgi:hypothetical protein